MRTELCAAHLIYLILMITNDLLKTVEVLLKVKIKYLKGILFNYNILPIVFIVFGLFKIKSFLGEKFLNLEIYN